MEQKENPVDAGTSVPDKENPYADLITFVTGKSILDPLIVLNGKIENVQGDVVEFGMVQNIDGVSMILYFGTPGDVARESILIGRILMIKFLRFLCDAARGVADTQKAAVSLFEDDDDAARRISGLGASLSGVDQ